VSPIAVVVPHVALLPLAVVVPPVAIVVPRLHAARCRRHAVYSPAARRRRRVARRLRHATLPLAVVMPPVVVPPVAVVVR